MKPLTILGILALFMLLVLPGAVSAADNAAVTVSGSILAPADLTVTAINPNVGAGAVFFANEPNVISVTVTNNGGLEAAGSTVEVIVGTDTYTTAVPAITAGGSQTVTVTDTISRVAGTVAITATADSAGIIAESNEANNALTQASVTIYNNGYKGKRWTPELGGDMTTQATFDGHYDVIYSAGNTAYNSAGWAAKTYIWTTADLPIPTGASVVSARLYQGYTYNQMGIDPSFIMSFNGNTVTPVAKYGDVKGYGSYSYPYGLYVYDVTDDFTIAGNSMTITPEVGNNYGIYGAYLIVTFSNPTTIEKQIFINDEFDMVYSGTARSVTSDEATVYAPFSGVDTTDISSAQAIAILASAGDSSKSKFFFNSQEYTGFWADYLSTPQIGFSVYDVTGALTSGANEARLQSYDGTSGDNMYAMNTILIVEKTEPEPVADFTYTPASGAAPLTVVFTDTSTGVVSSYAWDFNNDGTTDSNDENPSYTYTTAGTYSVKLTVTGPGGSDEELKDNIISVGTATIEVGVTPASIDFGTMSAGVDATKSTQVAVTTDGGGAWSVTAEANNGGYMKAGSNQLASAFQLANGGGSFQPMTSSFANFMTGTANEDRTDTANVKQAIATADAPGSYSITLTFTGGFV